MASVSARKRKKKRTRLLTEQVKPCRFTKDKTFEIDYRDVDLLRRFVSQQGKIQPRKKNSIASKYQRQLKTAIKRARFIGLLPTVGD